MADAGVCADQLECTLECVEDSERGVDTVLGDECANLVDLALSA
jgi:hypothetical protein